MWPARAVPYELNVYEQTAFSTRTVTLHFGNTGAVAAVFHVRSEQTSQKGSKTWATDFRAHRGLKSVSIREIRGDFKPFVHALTADKVDSYRSLHFRWDSAQKIGFVAPGSHGLHCCGTKHLRAGDYNQLFNRPRL